MEVLGGGTTVISLLQTAWQVIGYVKAVKSAGEAQQKVLVELVRARTLLNSLSDLAEDFKDDEWSRALQSLSGPHGVLSEFKALLEWIMDEMGVANPQQQGASSSIPTPTPGPSGHREKIRSKFSSRLASSARPAQKPKPNSPANTHDHSSNIGLKDAIKDITWPFKEAEVDKLLGKLESIKTHLLLALSSDNVRLSRLIRDELQSVHGEIGILREHQEGSKAWTEQQDLIFRFISRIDFSSRGFQDNIAELKKSAGILLQEAFFIRWLDDLSVPSLLLSGSPGSGKTSLCRVVENYLENLSSNSDTFVVAIYFSFRNRNKAQSLQAILAFIVETMLDQRPQIQKYYNRLMLTGEGPLEVDDSLRIIHRARQDFRNFYVLIDALDECDAQQAQVIVERLTGLRNPLKIFATSREMNLTTYFSNEIKMEQLLPRELWWKSSTLTGDLQGRFMAAQLAIGHLRDNSSTQTVDQILRSLPTTPGQLCPQIMEQINKQAEGDAALGRKVLSELLVAQEPMATPRLLDAVSGDAGWEATSDQIKIDKRIDRCIQCTKGLVMLVARDDGNFLQFVHHSVRDYLEAHRVS